MKPEIQELLKALPNTSHGQALKVFLDEQYLELGNVDNVTSYEDAVARQLARKVLRKLFDFYKDNKVGDRPVRDYR